MADENPVVSRRPKPNLRDFLRERTHFSSGELAGAHVFYLSGTNTPLTRLLWKCRVQHSHNNRFNDISVTHCGLHKHMDHMIKIKHHPV